MQILVFYYISESMTYLKLDYYYFLICKFFWLPNHNKTKFCNTYFFNKFNNQYCLLIKYVNIYCTYLLFSSHDGCTFECLSKDIEFDQHLSYIIITIVHRYFSCFSLFLQD